VLVPEMAVSEIWNGVFSERNMRKNEQKYLIKLERQNFVASLSNFDKVGECTRVSRGFKATVLRK
jgi:hypothetical protein